MNKILSILLLSCLAASAQITLVPLENLPNNGNLSDTNLFYVRVGKQSFNITVAQLRALLGSTNGTALATAIQNGLISTNQFYDLSTTPFVNGPIKTPPYMLNSWYISGPDFGYTNTANPANYPNALITTWAPALVNWGYRDAGLNWFIISEGASSPYRDPTTGVILWNTNRYGYQGGMKDAVDYLHNLGFKVGFYSEPTTLLVDSDNISYNYTYAGCPFDKIEIDATNFASIGFDGIDIDYRNYVNTIGYDFENNGIANYYRRWQRALSTCGRPIAMYASGLTPLQPWVPATLNMWDELGGTNWFTVGPYSNTLSTILIGDGTPWSEYLRFDLNIQYPHFVGPGHFIFQEIIPLALGDQSDSGVAHVRTCLSFAAMQCSAVCVPGLPTPGVQTNAMAAMQNPTWRAICDDPLVRQCTLLTRSNWADVYVKVLDTSSFNVPSKAVMLYNRATNATQNIQCYLPMLGYGTNQLSVFDVFSGTNVPVSGNTITMAVRTNNAILLLVQAYDQATLKALNVRTNALRMPSAIVPPVALDTYDYYGNGVSESNCVFMIDWIATNRMTDLGMRYFVISDGWASSNRSGGNIQADATKFPSGIAYLANRAHSYGIKLGLYTTDGTNTPTGRVGSGGSFTQDAVTFAGWGVDWVDFTITATANQVSIIQNMAGALDATGRPMFLHTVCNINPMDSHALLYANALFFRSSPYSEFTDYVTNRLMGTWNAVPYQVKPGSWASLGKLNWRQGADTSNTSALRTAMAMDAMMNAPIIVPIPMGPTTPLFNVLTNPEPYLLARDVVGGQATCVLTNNNTLVFVKPIGNALGPAIAVALINTLTNDFVTNNIAWTNISLPSGLATIHDMWARTNTTAADNFTVVTSTNDTSLFVMYPGTVQPFLGTLQSAIGSIDISAHSLTVSAAITNAYGVVDLATNNVLNPAYPDGSIGRRSDIGAVYYHSNGVWTLMGSGGGTAFDPTQPHTLSAGLTNSAFTDLQGGLHVGNTLNVDTTANETTVSNLNNLGYYHGVLPAPKVINVADYGAIADDSSDATIPINKALQFAATNNAGANVQVQLNEGAYRITGPLYVSNYVHLVGAGRENTFIDPQFGTNTAGSAIYADGLDWSIEKLMVYPTQGAYVRNADALRIGYYLTAYQFLIADFEAYGTYGGIIMNPANSWEGTITRYSGKNLVHGAQIGSSVKLDYDMISGDQSMYGNPNWPPITGWASNSYGIKFTGNGSVAAGGEIECENAAILLDGGGDNSAPSGYFEYNNFDVVATNGAYASLDYHVHGPDGTILSTNANIGPNPGRFHPYGESSSSVGLLNGLVCCYPFIKGFGTNLIDVVSTNTVPIPNTVYWTNTGPIDSALVRDGNVNGVPIPGALFSNSFTAFILWRPKQQPPGTFDREIPLIISDAGGRNINIYSYNSYAATWATYFDGATYHPISLSDNRVMNYFNASPLSWIATAIEFDSVNGVLSLFTPDTSISTNLSPSTFTGPFTAYLLGSAFGVSVTNQVGHFAVWNRLLTQADVYTYAEQVLSGQRGAASASVGGPVFVTGAANSDALAADSIGNVIPATAISMAHIVQPGVILTNNYAAANPAIVLSNYLTVDGPFIAHNVSGSGSALEVHTPNASPWLATFYNDTYSPTTPALEYYSDNSGNIHVGTDGAKDYNIWTAGYGNDRLTVKGDGSSVTATINMIAPGLLIHSNAMTIIPALNYGDNYYWSSNGVAYVICSSPSGVLTTNKIGP